MEAVSFPHLSQFEERAARSKHQNSMSGSWREQDKWSQEQVVERIRHNQDSQDQILALA